MKRAVLLAVLAGGCVAADPDAIKPMSISTVGYAALDCSALAAEDRRVADALGPLIRQQDNRRANDTLGILFIGVSQTGLGSPEYAAEISRLKGERETIASTKVSKGCPESQAEIVTKWSPSPQQLAEAKRKATGQP